MNDYFDALERELKTAVPRAARSHRRARAIGRLSPFHLGPFLVLVALTVASALALAGGLSHATAHDHPGPRPVGHQRHHERGPRRPDETTLLKGLVALRRRAALIGEEARALDRRMRTTIGAPVTSLLRFAVGTTALGGVQSVLVSTRRRINDPPQTATAAGAVLGVRATPPPCSARRHAPADHRRLVKEHLTSTSCQAILYSSGSPALPRRAGGNARAAGRRTGPQPGRPAGRA